MENTRIISAFLIRHGQKMKAKADPPLTEVGMDQIISTIKTITTGTNPPKIVRLVSSGMTRTQECAELARDHLGKESPPIKADPRFGFTYAEEFVKRFLPDFKVPHFDEATITTDTDVINWCPQLAMTLGSLAHAALAELITEIGKTRGWAHRSKDASIMVFSHNPVINMLLRAQDCKEFPNLMGLGDAIHLRFRFDPQNGETSLISARHLECSIKSAEFGN